MASGEYQAYVQREAAAGRNPITVSGWLKRQQRARAREQAEAVARAVRGV